MPNVKCQINLERIIEYLLYLFVFLLPWQTRWIIYDPLISGGVWEYGRISLYCFDVIFIILLACYFISFLFRSRLVSLPVAPADPSVRTPRVSARTPRVSAWVFFCFCAFVFLSILWSDYKILSSYWSLRIFQGILLIWILSKINFSKIKLAWAFVASVALSGILGIYQFLTQSAFASKWLGLGFHSARVLGDSVIEFADQRWLRAYGSFPHPNILAAFCVIAIILCIWILNKTQEKIKILFCYFITLILTTALFFTFSRAAWIALLVLSIVYIVLSIKNKDYYALRVTGYTLLLFLVLSLIFFPLVKTRIVAEQRLEVKSNIERVESYQQSFEIIKNNLWLGVGIGNYTNELQKTKPDQPAWAYQPVHNIYLLVLAELGIVGILLIVVLLYYFIANSANGLRPANIANTKLLKNNFYALLITGYALLFLFDHFWWTLPSGVLVVFLILGFINKKSPADA